MISDAVLHANLLRYWGYDSFRPLQQDIVRSLLEGHDTCVIMPTGGGKSLCYQLPAALLDRQTVIVISPLIALMQDQVAQLTQMGISAALLNSALSPQQQSVVMRKAVEGAYRLLYLSPERIARPDTVQWLQRVPVSFFAIDEAHCISEWGHEFRPDYRNLSALRRHFPDRCLAAFTASATQRVRHDIIAQLKMREPHKYLGSFHRPNLHYIVKECEKGAQDRLLVAALRQHGDSNVIVYAPTIARVEETVELLEQQGIAAIAYHGKMDSDTRRENQERWMSDEVRVLVGTVAFGLGINKAAVRAVIHLSLPKSVEQYYQEAGRAGRDGLKADCLLLWQKRDPILLKYFIGQLVKPEEQQQAWKRFREISDFAQSRKCRHRQICSHFGEAAAWPSCGACDVCGATPAWLSVPAPAARTAKRRKSSATREAAEPRGLSRSVSSGLSRSASGGPPLPRAPFKLTGAGYRDRDPHAAELEAPKDAVEPRGLGYRPRPKTGGSSPEAPPAGNTIREYLRMWRIAEAKKQGIPAFIVMHDTSLDELCAKQPRSLAELRGISGFGERKTDLYGEALLSALQRFRDTPPAHPVNAPPSITRAMPERST